MADTPINNAADGSESQTDSVDTGQAANTPPQPQSTVRFRWKIGVGVFVAGAVAETLAWNLISPDRTRQVFFSLGVLSATGLLLFLWWLFLSGLRWKTRLFGLVGVAAACGVFAALVRIDEFGGGMTPRLAWRWSPTAEERAKEYWRGLSPSTDDVTTREPLKVTVDDWPGFRGPRRDGIVDGLVLRRDWKERPPECLWRHPVGLGWSSFAVVGGFAFTQEQRGDEECVACYEIETGNQVWVHPDTFRFSESMGSDGPRATPSIYDSRVYALGATGLLNCLDALSGRIIWSRNILADADAKNMTWGMAASPLIYEGMVIVTPDGRDGDQVIAYDCETGEKVWAGGSRPASYSAPRIATVNGIPQILVFGGDGLAGFDPASGNELWFVEWPNDEQINVAQPILLDEEAIFISAGYGKGGALFPIVLQEGTWRLDPSPRWKTTEMKLKFNGAVLKDGFVYGLDESILACIDLRTGKRQWKRGRYGYGQLLLVDDLLVILAENGDVVLVEATPTEHRELARFEAIRGKTWNHPVIWHNRLLVRNSEEAACYTIE